MKPQWLLRAAPLAVPAAIHRRRPARRQAALLAETARTRKSRKISRQTAPRKRAWTNKRNSARPYLLLYCDGSCSGDIRGKPRVGGKSGHRTVLRRSLGRHRNSLDPDRYVQSLQRHPRLLVRAAAVDRHTRRRAELAERDRHRMDSWQSCDPACRRRRARQAHRTILCNRATWKIHRDQFSATAER